MLSRMVSRAASDFARDHLNAILYSIRKDDCNDFLLLVKKHFRSTNEKDPNWLALQNLKQKGHPRIMCFLWITTMFGT